MKTLLPCLLPLLFLTSCARAPFGGSADLLPASSPVSAGLVGGAVPAAEARLLRREGRLSMKTRSLEDSAARCVALVRTHKGRLETATLTEDDYRATIRVPSVSLEPLMDSLSDLGRVSRRSLSAEDVTDQFHDLEAEIKNTRALRDRLRDLLDKATTVQDTLAIEKELVRVQTKLDQLEGRLKRLKSQIALSSLSLEMRKGIALWGR